MWDRDERERERNTVENIEIKKDKKNRGMNTTRAPNKNN